MKRVELLAPAGNYEALVGAFAAGADAVYLGGTAFGARAYADNFSEEEIIRGIHLAHMLNKKVYLTVNTLVKEKEFPALYDFLLPYYRNGLDGVIIQDLGVLQYIKEHFPQMELHVSTQMTVTGSDGARLLKEEGAVRIVPARELSLAEIKEIKEKVDIEIEAFIHGAMCYCYSGQCLFSSILGGRSGNRGRCAQPCRLPYQVAEGREQYPLSMKDMCTLSMIPELIEAGIDSFKIEGRMKKPEYAAGVTALYRKYIELYFDNPAGFHVEEADLEYMKKLYIRSDIQEGYYHQHNGKNMITPSTPAYAGSDDALLAKIREKYLDKKIEIPVFASAVFLKEQPASMTLSFQESTVTVCGDVVQGALKQPLSEAKIKEQLLKSGNTDFVIDDLIITADDDIFMPIGALNQLRRDAFDALSEAIRQKFQRTTSSVSAGNENHVPRCTAEAVTQSGGLTQKDAEGSSEAEHKNENRTKHPEIHVLAGTWEQIKAAAEASVGRIYVDGCLLDEQTVTKLTDLPAEYGCEFYLAFPHIVRSKNAGLLEKLYEWLSRPIFSGVLVRNLETISFLEQKKNKKPLVTDCNLYVFNREAVSYFRKKAGECYLPVELNRREWQSLFVEESSGVKEERLSAMVYGRLPMMVTANCLKKTTDCCDGKQSYITLTDRYRKEFPVYTNCSCCYNVIYNSVPLSLHKLFDMEQAKQSLWACRLDFTTESGREASQIIAYFKGLHKKYTEPFYHDFTTGHFKRGVE